MLSTMLIVSAIIGALMSSKAVDHSSINDTEQTKSYESSVHIKPGEVYGKPFGNCYYNLTTKSIAGCRCGFNSHFYSEYNYLLGKVYRVMCTTVCWDFQTSSFKEDDCPSSPIGTPACDGICLIKCSTDEDCPHSATCDPWRNSEGRCFYHVD